MPYRYQYNRHYGPLNPGKDNRISQRQAKSQGGKRERLLPRLKAVAKKKKCFDRRTQNFMPRYLNTFLLTKNGSLTTVKI